MNQTSSIHNRRWPGPHTAYGEMRLSPGLISYVGRVFSGKMNVFCLLINPRITRALNQAPTCQALCSHHGSVVVRMSGCWFWMCVKCSKVRIEPNS